MRKQKTIKKEVSFSGVGLHTGKKTTITFKPAPADTGMVFVRVDLPERPHIKADVDHVTDVARGTTIGLDGVKVLTIEHVLGAFAGLGIDNIYAEVDASEAPVGDGSALPFIDALTEAGLVEQNAPAKEARVEKPVICEVEGVTLMAFPSEQLKVSYMIEYGHPALGVQFRSCVIDPALFTLEIAPARTYCFLHDVERLQRQGLIKGGSLENAVVIGDEGILNEALRFEDEFVRHKILDLLGDLALLGSPLVGHVVAMKAGHSSHVEFVKRLRSATGKKGTAPPEAPPPASEAILDIHQICEILPHRDPFLFVDKITRLAENSIRGIKNVSISEPHFRGHIPGSPIMPGVLILEAMAQVGAILVLKNSGNEGTLPYMLSIDKAKFRKAVYPGDQLTIDVNVVNVHKRFGKLRGEARVGENLAAEAELTFLIP